MEKTDKFPSWKPYEHCKALAHRLRDYGLMDKFRAWCNGHVNYLEPTFSIHPTILTLHTIVNVVISSLKRFYSKKVVSMVMFEALKLGVADSVDFLSKQLSDSNAVCSYSCCSFWLCSVQVQDMCCFCYNELGEFCKDTIESKIKIYIHIQSQRKTNSFEMHAA